MSLPYRFDVISDYASSESEHISYSPYWAIAIFGMAKPVTFSRDEFKSGVSVSDGVKLRTNKPLIITDACVGMDIDCNKRGHTKSLSVNIKNMGLNLLNSQNAVPGDWVMAWCWTNEVDRDVTLKKIQKGEAANGPRSGLKFVGRLHDIRKTISVSSPEGMKEASYSIQAIGFDELDAQLYYDFNLASAAANANNSSDFALFMAQIGLNFFDLQEKFRTSSDDSILQDNSAPLIEGLIDIIVGESNRRGNEEVKYAQGVSNVSGDRDLTRTTVDSYVIPKEVASALGVATEQGKVNKYSNILETLIGVQSYTLPPSEEKNNTPTGFYPETDETLSRRNRYRTKSTVKGSHLPLEPSFVNRPLYSVLQTYLNPAINEMYTTLKLNKSGNIVPTLVVRQIPFSTEAMAKKESTSFPLTRFLSLPRWVISPTMVSSMSVGRSNSTRFNMVHVYGEANMMSDSMSITRQMVLNPPIFDLADIARSGMRPLMYNVNCTLKDQAKQAESRPWLEAISDWTLGSHLTLNGQITTTGIQSAISEGDNIEFEGVVYHIESIKHRCAISGDGRKTFNTTLSLSNGMPENQEDVSTYPRYPGFKAQSQTTEITTSVDIDIPEESGDEPYGIDNLNGLKRQDKSVKQTIEYRNRETTHTLTPDDEILTSQDPGEGVEH